MRTAAIILLVLIVAIGALLAFQNLQTPTHLGVKDGKLAPMPSKPNAVSSQTDVADKKVEPLPFKDSLEETLAQVKSALTAMEGQETQTQQSDYIYTIFTTPLMRYHDDVEVYLDEDTRLVHFRSQSRAGYSDRGVNRKRYEAFRALYLN